MSSKLASDPVYKKAAEGLQIKSDFTLYGLSVDTNETLTGTPTVTVTPTGMTAGAPTINTAPFTNAKRGTCEIGKGVLFLLSGGTAGSDYSVSVQCGTSLGQTLEGTIPVYVRAG